MTTSAAVVLSVGLALLLVAAFTKKGRKAISGVIGTDGKGRTTLVIWPTGKRKRRKKRR